MTNRDMRDAHETAQERDARAAGLLPTPGTICMCCGVSSVTGERTPNCAVDGKEVHDVWCAEDNYANDLCATCESRMEDEPTTAQARDEVRTVTFEATPHFAGIGVALKAADRFTRARDAAWMLGALDGTGGPRDRTHDDQETDMPLTPIQVITSQLENITDHLAEIRDRLPERVTLHDLDDVAAEFGVDLSDDEPADITEEPPVEFKAGDRVSFAYCGDRITCTLVDGQWGLMSDTPDENGYRPRVMEESGGLAPFIADVRPEPAPADVDPDEGQPLWRLRSRLRGATRYIEKLEADLARVTEERGKYAASAEKWQARHAALRHDLVSQAPHGAFRWTTSDVLTRDDERAES